MNKKIAAFKKDFFEHFFRDKNGKVVLGQTPNLPLIVFIVSRVIEMLLSGNLQQIAEIVAFGSLFTWAWLELFQGTNYFRRLLGLIVLMFTVANRIS